MSVPALRFKEFSGDWTRKSFNEITGKIGDGLHSTPIYDDSGQYYFVNGNNLTNSKIEISEATKRVNEVEYLKHKIELTPHTILISINGTIGNLAFYNNEKVVLGKSACYINLKQSENKYFVFNLLQTSNITQHFDKELTGSTIKNLSLTTIKNTKAYFPSLPEQTKIANFLTAVDEKITLLTQKASLLSQYKKGVMQQIFSQELRFKDDDGQAFPEWEDKRLGEITLKVGSGSTPKGGAVIYQSFGIPFIRSQNINNEQLLLDDITFIPEKINNKMKGSVVKPNDILLNITGASIGRSCVVPSEFKLGNVNQHVCIIRLKSEYAPRYIQPYLSSSRGQKSIASTQVGSGREGLNFEAIRSFKIPTPSLPEQTKIANLLTAIDEKITTNQKQLDAVKQYKQGLLQQMFV